MSNLLRDDVEKYIVKKLFKIARTYNRYKKYLDCHDGLLDEKHPKAYNIQPRFYNVKDDHKNFVNYLLALKKDKSHITFKLNQAINYLRNNPLKEEKDIKWAIDDKNKVFDISPSRLSKRIAVSDTTEIINFIPPSLFNVEFFLEEIEKKDRKESDKKNKSIFGSLSSGEQQLIQSIQSVVYHINNLNSVFNNDSNEIKYRYVNIILDEIELYFHPEFQRIFVSTLIFHLKNANLENIKGINIIFSTHSPFILSDIPSSNILRLKDGIPEPESNQTFGSNIHDLLANDFFLNKGFMGEFAKGKISEVIKFYNKVCGIEKSEYSGYKEDYHKKKESFNYILGIIGEPVIKSILENHINYLNDYFQENEKN